MRSHLLQSSTHDSSLSRTAAVSTPTVTFEANSEDLHIFKSNKNTIMIHEEEADGAVRTDGWKCEPTEADRFVDVWLQHSHWDRRMVSESLHLSYIKHSSRKPQYSLPSKHLPNETWLILEARLQKLRSCILTLLWCWALCWAVSIWAARRCCLVHFFLCCVLLLRPFPWLDLLFAFGTTNGPLDRGGERLSSAHVWSSKCEWFWWCD